MRILHTADWHLGRTLHGADLSEAHMRFFDWLTDLVRDREVDLVLVSGDIFDRALPPLSSLNLADRALKRLCHLAPVVLIPGNHDSASRLGFASSLMRKELRVISRSCEVGTAVEVSSAHGDVLIYPVPYLEPDLARETLATTETPLPRSHEAVLGAAIDRIGADLSARRTQGDLRPAIAMFHAFIHGGTESDSERDIRVGGIGSVPAGLFSRPNLSYVALGHLHRPQNVLGASCPVRYSGSPMPFSFSEAHDTKSVTLVDVAPNGQVDVEVVPTPIYRPLSVLEGPMEYLLSAETDAHVNHWLTIRVTDPARPSEMAQRLRARFPHALLILHTPPHSASSSGVRTTNFQQRGLRHVALDFFSDVGGRELTPAEIHVLDEVLIAMQKEISA